MARACRTTAADQAGRVVNLGAAVGQFAQPGTALMMFVPDDIWVTANYKETQLDAIRPELVGNRIQEVLGIGPGREVGEAYRFLLELRMEQGPLGPDAAGEELRRWWAARHP